MFKYVNAVMCLTSVTMASRIFTSRSKLDSALLNCIPDWTSSDGSLCTGIASWNVTAVNDLSKLFEKATAFEQDITGWVLGGVSPPSRTLAELEHQDVQKNGILNEFMYPTNDTPEKCPETFGYKELGECRGYKAGDTVYKWNYDVNPSKQERFRYNGDGSYEVCQLDDLGQVDVECTTKYNVPSCATPYTGLTQYGSVEKGSCYMGGGQYREGCKFDEYEDSGVCMNCDAYKPGKAFSIVTGNGIRKCEKSHGQEGWATCEAIKAKVEGQKNGNTVCKGLPQFGSSGPTCENQGGCKFDGQNSTCIYASDGVCGHFTDVADTAESVDTTDMFKDATAWLDLYTPATAGSVSGPPSDWTAPRPCVATSTRCLSAAYCKAEDANALVQVFNNLDVCEEDVSRLRVTKDDGGVGQGIYEEGVAAGRAEIQSQLDTLVDRLNTCCSESV